MLPKTVIWIVILLGLAPSAFIATLCVFALTIRVPHAKHGVTFLHDAYLQVVAARVPLQPQPWSAGLLILGITLVLVGLTAVLHGPSH